MYCNYPYPNCPINDNRPFNPCGCGCGCGYPYGGNNFDNPPYNYYLSPYKGCGANTFNQFDNCFFY